MARSLADLPPEILDGVVCQFDSLSDLTHLSLASKSLHNYAEKHGYRAFAREKFPSYRPPPYWKEAVRSLTGITKCWERRSFFARCIEPPPHTSMVQKNAPEHRASIDPNARRRGQSIPFPGVVACYEQWIGGDWTSRRETLAIGAGAELQLRTRLMGPTAYQAWDAASPEDRRRDYDQFGHQQRWLRYRDEQHSEGKCDITTLSILPSASDANQQKIICGRACGALEGVTVQDKSIEDTWSYSTKKGSIRFADANAAQDPLVIAGQRYDLALFSARQEDESSLQPVEHIHFEKEGRGGVLWACRFLDQTRFALGRDSVARPLSVYEIRPEGLDTTPSWALESRVLFSCVKTLCPLAHSQVSNSSSMFLSAWKSGAVLLHDTRSSEHHVASFTDSIDASSIFYSLLPFGMERFLAGSNKHGTIKVFDLRKPGARSYSTINVPRHREQMARPVQTNGTNSTASISRVGVNDRTDPLFSRSNFTLFLKYGRKWQKNRHESMVPSVNLKNSSVYHLAAGSPFSPTFYAGLQGNIAEFDLVSARDPFPDVAFDSPVSRKPPRERTTFDVEQWLDPATRQIYLGRVEQEQPNRLLSQQEAMPRLHKRTVNPIATVWASQT